MPEWDWSLLDLKFPPSTWQIMKQTTEKRHRTVAFRVLTGHKPAAAQAWLPNRSLTSHSSHTGISFRQLAFRVAPLTRQGGEFFPLTNGTSLSFQERGGWKRKKGVPLGGNRLCIPGLKGLQQWLVTSTGWDMSWDGFPLVFLADTQPYWLYSAGVCTVWVKWFGKVTVLPAWNCKGCNLLEVLKLFWFKLCLDHLRNMLSVTVAILLTLS